MALIGWKSYLVGWLDLGLLIRIRSTNLKDSEIVNWICSRERGTLGGSPHRIPIPVNRRSRPSSLQSYKPRAFYVHPAE